MKKIDIKVVLVMVLCCAAQSMWGLSTALRPGARYVGKTQLLSRSYNTVDSNQPGPRLIRPIVIRPNVPVPRARPALEQTPEATNVVPLKSKDSSSDMFTLRDIWNYIVDRFTGTSKRQRVAGQREQEQKMRMSEADFKISEQLSE